MKKLNTTFTVLALVLIAAPALAQGDVETATAVATDSSRGWLGMAAAITMGLAALGGTYGQAKGIVAGLEGISRNPAAQPKIFIPMIVGLALIESLVVLAFLIANGLAS